MKELLQDFVALCRGIDVAVPGKVDAEFVRFLEESAQSEWALRMLHTALDQQKGKLRKAV